LFVIFAHMNIKKYIHATLLIFFTIMLLGCSNDDDRLIVDEIVLENNSLAPKRIHGHNDRLIVSSGDIWNTSDLRVYYFKNETSNLIHQISTPKTILDFFSVGSQTFGIGIDGHFITYDILNDTLFQKKLPYWGFSNYFFRSGPFNVVSSGKAFRFGKVSVFDEQFSALCELDIPMEVSRTLVLSDTLVTFGFGCYLVFDQDDCTWLIKPLEGFFLTDAVSVDNRDEFVAIDIRGSLVKGKFRSSEISIQNQQNLGARKIIRVDDEIALVGDDGLFMITRNQGDSWERYKIEGEADLIDLAKVANSWIVLTSEGRLLKIQK